MDLTSDFRGSPARDLSQRVEADDFVHGVDVHVLVSPRNEFKLRKPTVLNALEEMISIQTPLGMPAQPPGFLSRCFSPDLTITKLSDVICVPGGVALKEPNFVIDESFSAYWEKDYHHHLEMVESNSYRLKGAHQAPNPIFGTYLFLDYQHIEHYGHFMMDVVTRIWSFKYCQDYLHMRDLRVLISGPVRNSYIIDTIKAAGIPEAKITVITEPVICEELIVATKAAQLQEYSTLIAAETWKTIAESFDKRQLGNSRVYFSRTRNPQRVCTNEGDVERLFVMRGFKVVHAQDYSEDDKINACINAELVAGCSGTNLYNMAFQSRLRSAFILVSPLLIHYIDQFITIGTKADLRYYIGHVNLTHPGADLNYVHSPWEVDINDLEYHLDRWLREVS